MGGVPTIEAYADPLSQQYTPGSEEAIAVWNQHKVERNALIAVVVNRVIDRAVADREKFPPFGLARRRFGYHRIKEFAPKRYPYLLLDQGISHTLRRALDIEVYEIEKLAGTRQSIASWASRIFHPFGTQESQAGAQEQSIDPLVGVYRRLNKIIMFGHRYLPDYYKKETSSTPFFIRRGISTAAETMTAILAVIPKVYEKQFPDHFPDPTGLVEILRNSYPLLVDSSAQHVYMLNRQRNCLGKEWPPFSSYSYSYDPANFEIQAAANGFHLAVRNDIKKQIETTFGIPPVDFKDSTEITGCPALVSFGNGSPIKKLWEWYVEIGEAVYGNIYALPKEETGFKIPSWLNRPARALSHSLTAFYPR